MPANHLLTIDQGTTSTRAILFDRDGRPLATEQRPLRQHFPDDGWVEHEPEDIWADTLAACRGCLTRAGLGAEAVAAIGISNQRETTILWDRATGEAIHRAIVWQDRRTAAYCRALARAGHEPMVRARTGLLLDPYFSATKIHWLLENVAGARARAEAGELAFGTVDSFLLYRLTGGRVHATDATNAARTLLYDIRVQDWDEELLALFGIPRAILPEVRDNSAGFGAIEADLLGAPVPVAGMAGDQHAALVGQACFTPGAVKSTYGTGCFALANIGEEFVESQHRLLTTIGYRLGGRTTYAIEGSVFIAGAAIQWLRDEVGLLSEAADSAEMASAVEDTGGVYLVPAFTGLGAPHWDADARGALLGITRDTGARHIVRAALEAQGYQTRDLIEAMGRDIGRPLADMRIDGGMVVNDWLCQFLADINGIAVERPVVAETSALGAAYLAGLGIGLYDSLDDIAVAWRGERRFEPAMAPTRRDALYDGWRRAVGRVRGDGA